MKAGGGEGQWLGVVSAASRLLSHAIVMCDDSTKLFSNMEKREK